MRIIPRAESGLAAPRKAMAAFRFPARELYLHHTVTPISVHPTRDWRVVQQAGFGRDFADISYNFGIHPYAKDPLEGREMRWVGAHTENRNAIAFGIALIGNYNDVEPTKVQVDAVRWLRHFLVESRVLTPNHHFGYHQQRDSTACPGRQAIAMWDRFNEPWTTEPAPPTPIKDDEMLIYEPEGVGALFITNGQTTRVINSPEEFYWWAEQPGVRTATKKMPRSFHDSLPVR